MFGRATITLGIGPHSSCEYVINLLWPPFLAWSQPSQIGYLPYFHTLCGLSANLRCRSETHCTWLAENTGRKKVAKHRHLGTIGKKLVKQQYLLHMSPQYGELRPTSGWDRSSSLGTPAKFSGFRVLAALLHGTPVSFFFFPHLISAIADWMSTILPHMVWP